MKFDRLRNSLEINSDEMPSVYLALCMIETVFRDIKDESGRDVSEIETGDENWALKLSLAYRTLNKIYKNNQDELNRVRKQLDELKQQADSYENDLDALTNIQTEVKRLKESVEEAKGERDFYNSQKKDLLYQSGQLEEEIKKLTDDITELQHEAVLADRKNQIDVLQARYDSLKIEKNKEQEELDKAKAEVLALENALIVLKSEADKQIEKKAELNAEEAKCKSIIDKYASLCSAEGDKILQSFRERSGLITQTGESIHEVMVQFSEITGKDSAGLSSVEGIIKQTKEIGVLLDRLRNEMNKLSLIAKMEVYKQ